MDRRLSSEVRETVPVQRRGVLVFVAGAYSITWLLWVVLRAPAAAGSPRAPLVFLLGTVWSPTVLALLIAWRIERKPFAALLRSSFRMPSSGGWFAAAALVPALTILFALLVSRALGHASSLAEPSSWLSVLAFRIATGATGEELGWRAYLVSRLTSRFGIHQAAIASGLLWSGWHVAGVVFPNTGLDIVPRLPFFLFTALFGIFLAFALSCTRGNVLAPMLAHLSLNFTLGLSGAPLAAPSFWWTLVLGTAVAVSFAALSVGRLTMVESPYHE
jgi:membrane protease YdiL (CAAX protease family)